MSDVAPPHRREIELDFIRGIAILMVIDFHSPHTLLLAPFAWLGFQNFGWAGVDIFFVLSVFLVGGLLVKEWKLRPRIDARRFLIRRGFKIWPQFMSISRSCFCCATASSTNSGAICSTSKTTSEASPPKHNVAF